MDSSTAWRRIKVIVLIHIRRDRREGCGEGFLFFEVESCGDGGVGWFG